MRLLTVATMIAVTLTGCAREFSCGWDPSLAVGATLDVDLVELYTPASTTARYSSEFALTRPAETCAGLDELAVGEPIAVELVQGPSASLDCSFWFGEIVEPDLGLGPQTPGAINNVSLNGIYVGSRRDFGGGCAGTWEFSLHSTGNDPFMDQTAGARPVLMAYRVFRAPTDADAACSALVGRAPTAEPFSCGDAFVARMTRR